ncbi:hypothetical protein MBLNU230_g7265t1 [Neophaeotheca triangularis]
MQAMSPSNAAQHAGAAQGEQQPPKVAALDPQNSPRLYYEDPVTRVKREVWRPGDSSSREPYVNEKNEPPHYVFLDDRTAHAVVESNITKFRKGLFWPHDFTEMGTIRARRVHRGNAAMTHPEKSGEEKFGHVMVGHKKAEKAKYVFHGEKRWKEIIYKGLENANGDTKGSVTCSTTFPQTSTTLPGIRLHNKKNTNKVPANDRSQPSGHDKNGKEKHGHNQFTPRGELKAKPETGMINRFLRKRARSPQLPEPRKVRQILGGQKFRSGSPNTSERGPSAEVHEASSAFGSSPPVQASGPDATTKDNVIAHLREQLAAADKVIAANTLEMARLRERLEEQRAQLEQNGKDMEGLLDLLKEVPEYAERMAASDEDAGDVAGAGVAEGGGMGAEQAGMGGAMGGGVGARGGHGEGEFGGDF